MRIQIFPCYFFMCRETSGRRRSLPSASYCLLLLWISFVFGFSPKSSFNILLLKLIIYATGYFPLSYLLFELSSEYQCFQTILPHWNFNYLFVVESQAKRNETIWEDNVSSKSFPRIYENSYIIKKREYVWNNISLLAKSHFWLF